MNKNKIINLLLLKHSIIQLLGLLIGISVITLVILISLKIIKVSNDNFENGDTSMPTPTTIINKVEKDRTKLYGSLFLDNLDKQIKNLTDPKINYNTKRIDIIKYNDILL